MTNKLLFPDTWSKEYKEIIERNVDDLKQELIKLDSRGDLQDLINHLRELSYGGEFLPDCLSNGICCEIESHFNLSYDFVAILSMDWEGHSGSYSYPIKSVIDCTFSVDNIWVGAEGDSRRELCAYLADKLEKGIDSLFD